MPQLILFSGHLITTDLPTIQLSFSRRNGAHTSRAHDAINSGLKINGPFRGTKLTIWDGGFRVPFIVRWPGEVVAGSTSDDLINLVDIYATIAELLKLDLSAPDVETPNSYSTLSSCFEDSETEKRCPMVYTSYEGVVAIR